MYLHQRFRRLHNADRQHRMGHLQNSQAIMQWFEKQ